MQFYTSSSTAQEQKQLCWMGVTAARRVSFPLWHCWTVERLWIYTFMTVVTTRVWSVVIRSLCYLYFSHTRTVDGKALIRRCIWSGLNRFGLSGSKFTKTGFKALEKSLSAHTPALWQLSAVLCPDETWRQAGVKASITPRSHSCSPAVRVNNENVYEVRQILTPSCAMFLYFRALTLNKKDKILIHFWLSCRLSTLKKKKAGATSGHDAHTLCSVFGKDRMLY